MWLNGIIKTIIAWNEHIRYITGTRSKGIINLRVKLQTTHREEIAIASLRINGNTNHRKHKISAV